MTGSVFRICQKILPKPHFMDRPIARAAKRTREPSLAWVPDDRPAAREAHR